MRWVCALDHSCSTGAPARAYPTGHDRTFRHLSSCTLARRRAMPSPACPAARAHARYGRGEKLAPRGRSKGGAQPCTSTSVRAQDPQGRQVITRAPRRRDQASYRAVRGARTGARSPCAQVGGACAQRLQGGEHQHRAEHKRGRTVPRECARRVAPVCAPAPVPHRFAAWLRDPGHPLQHARMARRFSGASVRGTGGFAMVP